MRIVVLDGYTLNPGDLGWGPLAALGVLTVHDRTPAALVAERAAGAQVLLTNKVVLDRRLFEGLPDLRYVGVLATGYNVVDVAAAAERGIVVTNVPAYGTASVAQLVFALLLELTHATGRHDGAVRRGDWSAGADFSFTLQPLVELAGMTLGVVGFGDIGRAVAAIGRGFGMAVLAHTRSPAPAEGVAFVALDDLFRRADVVTLHCPLTPQTAGMVDARRLALMKPTAYLVNTARGPLVDEAALAEALRAGRLAGAGLDVLSAEPPPPDHPLLSAPRCVVTPHLGWATQAARRRLLEGVAGNLAAWMDGRPRNVVR